MGNLLVVHVWTWYLTSKSSRLSLDWHFLIITKVLLLHKPVFCLLLPFHIQILCLPAHMSPCVAKFWWNVIKLITFNNNIEIVGLGQGPIYLTSTNPGNWNLLISQINSLCCYNIYILTSVLILLCKVNM